MRRAALVLLGYLLLIVLGAAWRITPFEVTVPNLSLIMAAYFGITAREHIAGATLAAIVVGYLSDLVGGSPLGLSALIAGVGCMGARLVTARLLVRGRGFIFVLLSSMSLVAAGLSYGLRAYHGAGRAPLANEALIALGCAVVTGVLALPVFRLCRSVDARFARTEREREAVREGFLN
jgi:cell shape-determining protein MreD